MIGCIRRLNSRFVTFVGAALLMLLLSACETVPPPGPPTPPPRFTGHVVNVRRYLPVRVAMSLKSAHVGRLYPGDGVFIDDISGDWCRIEGMDTSHGRPPEGWVLRRYVAPDQTSPRWLPPESGLEEEEY